MALSKVAEAVREMFEAVAPGGPEGEERKMFGYPACFVHGNMFMGLHESGFVFKLPPDAREAALAAGALPFAPLAGRVMKSFVVWDAATLPAEPELRRWVAAAYGYVASLPPKPARPRASR
ncbi:MAG TPA: TfoX/Sxy family protein [Tepidiformaceae bacterium]|nr:TfoX/Sxy family protein [Tepidiformaceae bacterium]HNO65381.1 TfoX/Sxy family protein [Tepidiformaceae bacterium]